MKDSKPLMVLTALLIVVFLFSIIVYLLKISKDNQQIEPTITPTVSETPVITDKPIITSEIEHNLQLGIISPEESIILQGQARMYKALITGNSKLDGARINCNWRFFLNENNEETLYEEMNNSTVMSGESKEVCGFTSSFIEKKGKLRVQLTISFANLKGEDLGTISTERFYTVLD